MSIKSFKKAAVISLGLLSSGYNLTFASDSGFPRILAYASLADAQIRQNRPD
jgi:hypothetical protein